MNAVKPKGLLVLVFSLILLLLAACAQNQPPEALEEQSAAQSVRVDFPASIQFDEEMETFDFTGSVNVVVQCRTNPRSSCDINTNLSNVSGTGRESNKRFQVVGASQHNFSRSPAGEVYEFFATYSVAPQDPLIPAVSLSFKVTVAADGRVTNVEVEHYDVIIPDTTKVTDDATRAALTFFDLNSGIMRFNQNTPVLQNLRRGDVLVSEPSGAAPAGYLRKVVSIRRSGGEVVLETVQANITEAITQGGFSSTGDFDTDDVADIVIHLEGVEVVDPPADELTPQAGVGGGVNLPALRFNQVILNVGEGDVQGQVRLNGELTFKAGWGVELDIRTCWEIPPVCVRRFEAFVGLEERLEVELSGEANVTLGRDFKIATYYFEPLVFFIGPVPVIVTTGVEVFVGVSGEVRLNFHYSATQTAKALLGARWTASRDWEDISGLGIHASGFGSVEANATFKARAYGRALASMKLYDLAGPAVGLMASLELDVGIPRDPTWILNGHLEGYMAFVVGLPIIGTLREYRTPSLHYSSLIAEAPNQAPRFSNVFSGDIVAIEGVSLLLGPRGSQGGYFDVTDPEGHRIRLSARYVKDGGMTSQTIPTTGLNEPLRYAFMEPGNYDVTVTARDEYGAESSPITLSVVINAAPPTIYTYAPVTSVPQGVEYHISAKSRVQNRFSQHCDRLSWQATLGGRTSNATITTVQTSTDRYAACRAVIVFDEQGSHTVTVTATNGDKVTVKTLSVTVGPPPAGAAPSITDISITAEAIITSSPFGLGGCIIFTRCEVPEGALVSWPGESAYDLPFYFRATATHPSGAPLTVQWSCTHNGIPVTVFDDAGGLKRCSRADDQGGLFIVRVAVSDGVTTVHAGRSFTVGTVLR